MSDLVGSDIHGSAGSHPASGKTGGSTSATSTEEKCCFRSCKVRGARHIPCRNPDCDKVVHLMCCQAYLFRKHSLPALPGGNVACTKRCYAKAAKELAGGDDVEGARKGGWDSDRKGDEGRTSIRILLDWWMTEGNYARFCGKHNDGKKKKEFCESLAKTMTQETSTARDWKNVWNKISHVEKKWCDAHNFATSETGAGIQARDGVASFEEAVKKKCPYYYDLLEIMGDRASSQPMCTNYDDDNDEDSVLSLSDVSDRSNAVSVAAASNRRTSVGSSNTTRSVAPSPAVIVVADGSTRKRKSSPGDNSSSNKKKTKRNNVGSMSSSKRSNSVLMDDKAVNALLSSNKAAEDRMLEMTRHNKVMEQLEEKKQQFEEKKQQFEEKKLKSLSWKGKNDELEYKMNLLRKYREIKTNFHWSDEKIAQFYPDMQQVMEHGDDSSEDHS
eukprot:scaffold18779_cov93-Cylindrotheca_fusiformis.AAC.2